MLQRQVPHEVSAGSAMIKKRLHQLVEPEVQLCTQLIVTAWMSDEGWANQNDPEDEHTEEQHE